MKPYPLCLVKISKDFTAGNMKLKTRLNGYMYDFSVDNIIDIHKYLMKKYKIK